MLVFNLHHIEPVTQHEAYHERRHLTITPDGLRRFIKTLRLAGLEIISLRQALDNGLDELVSPQQGAHAKSARQVVLTIDDGYVNNMIHAAPVLNAERVPATIFVLPGRFGGTNAWDQGEWPEEKRDRLMTAEQMRELAQSSPYITYGSHGLYHTHLPQVTPEVLRDELYSSHEILSRELGDAYLPVFAYPWGEYSPEVVAHMEESPYRCAFTVVPDRWKSGTPRFEIPRYSVFHRDGNPLVTMAKLARHGLLNPSFAL
jgi:peptidoglycan/xylan/chitin deacetylase (PgdA/CDA1 family)